MNKEELVLKKIYGILKDEYPVRGSIRNVAKIFSQLIQLYDIENEKNIDQLCFEAVWEEFLNDKVRKNIDNIEGLYEEIVKGEYKYPTVISYDEGEGSICYFPDEEKKILIFEKSRINFVIILSERFIHIRQFWDKYENNMNTGINSEKKAILSGDWLIEMFSDNIDGVSKSLILRPDLQNYIDTKFSRSDNNIGLQYGDGRDKGYVVTVDLKFDLIHDIGCFLTAKKVFTCIQYIFRGLEDAKD